MTGASGTRRLQRPVRALGAAVAGIVLASVGLAACSGGGSSAGTDATSGPQVTLTYWDTNPADTRTPLWKTAIAGFEKLHPNIKVEYTGVPQGDSYQKIETAIAGGQVPDVANGLLSTIAPYIAQGGLLPLDSDFASWDQASDFSKDVMDLARSAASDGKLYAIPFTSNVDVVYYRKDLLQKAGAPDPGSSWDNFYAATQALTDTKDGMYGFSMRGGQGSVLAIESWLYSATGTDTFFDASGKSTLDSPAMVAALQRWLDMYGKVASKNDLNNDYKAISAAFGGNQAAMYYHNLGSYTQQVTALGADKVGVTVLPPAPNGKITIPSIRQTGNFVFKGSKHPKEAWLLASYLSSAVVQSPYNQAIGQLPTSTKVLGEPWVKANSAIAAAQAAVQSPNAVVVKAPIAMPAYSSIQTEMEPELQKAILGQVTAQAFLHDWASKLTEARTQSK